MATSPHSAVSARIASFLKAKRDAGGLDNGVIQRRPKGLPVEVSQEQRRIWLHCAVAGHNEIYNDALCLRIQTELDTAAFERAFNEILKRHEAWRTSFQLEDGKLLQNVSPEMHVALPVVDLQLLKPEKRLERLNALITRELKVPFRLEEAPLFRAHLVRMANREFRFVLVVHHLIADGVSMFQVFLPELYSSYTALTSGVAPTLPELPFQYPDYSEWQRRSLDKQKLASDLAFWEKELSGELPIVKLPCSRPTSATNKSEAEVTTFSIPHKTIQGLKDFASSSGASIFMCSLAAFCIALYQHTGARDQVLGTVSSTRKQFGTEKLLGLFINLIPLRIGFAADQSYRDLVDSVRRTVLNALEREVPFDALVRRFGRQNPSVTPIFQIIYVLEPSPAGIFSEWQVDDLGDHAPPARWDLTVQVQEIDEELHGRLIYRKDVFESRTMAALSRDWVKLLGDVAADPGISIEKLSAQLRTGHSVLPFGKRIRDRFTRAFGQLSRQD